MFLLTHDYNFGERVKLCHDTGEIQVWMVVAIQTSLDGHQDYSLASGDAEYIAANGELLPISVTTHKPPYSTLVESQYELGDTVYIVHDEETRLCTIMRINVCWDSSIMYQVLCGADFMYWAVSNELSVDLPSDPSVFDDNALDDSQTTSE